MPGDYDADAKTDIAVWRPSTGVWYILLSGTAGGYRATQWGMNGDVPTVGDFDADGQADIAVRRPGSGVWYVRLSSAPGSYIARLWGLGTDEAISSSTVILRSLP